MSEQADEGQGEIVGPADVEGRVEEERWSFVTLIAHHGVEPPANLSDDLAESTWAAVSGVWHPALLSLAAKLPAVSGVEDAALGGGREMIVLAGGQSERLPSGIRVQAEDAGSKLIDGGRDRAEIVARIREHVKAGNEIRSEEMDALALDFQALGTLSWWIKDLTLGMGHADCVDHAGLEREAIAGAKAWKEGDANTARNRLRAAFEVLTAARERIYPVDAYIIDLCLLDAAMPGGVLAEPLSARTAVTIIAPAEAIEAQAERDAEGMARLREAITEGWADVVGGAYREVEEPLLPLKSILWQFRHGGEVYRSHLDQRNVETLVRRRFGLYPMLPQIGKRFGFRFAAHLGFDAGKFPVRPEAKRLWESPDHTNLESLTRPPIAADRAAQGALFAWRVAKTMKDDHVATLPLIHWPGGGADWYKDLRRAAAYGAVIARWVTLNDYFHLTDRPYEIFSPEADDYVTPYLAQAIALKDLQPITRLASHAKVRARFDSLSTMRAIAHALGTAEEADEPSFDDIEKSLETGRLEEAGRSITSKEPIWSKAAGKGVVGTAVDGRPGFLVINPLGVPRRAAVLLAEAAPDLRPEGPLRAAQFTEEGVWGVVDLPAFGYAWVPRDTNLEAPAAPMGVVSARDRILKNESIVAEIDPASGGLRGVKAVGEDTARVAQQLAISGLVGANGKPVVTKMKAASYEVEYGGPALVQAVSKGSILGVDDRPLAKFRQRVRLWTGRPVLELEVSLEDLDPEWMGSIADADPWSNYLACRWAWPDPASMLRRTCLLSPELTDAERPETPDAIDISTRRQRTALLFGGLSHHKRFGTRMLDTLLVAGRETGRTFQLGVTLDQEHPFHASSDMLGPAIVVPTEAGPPRTGPTGWLFQLDHRGIAVTGVEMVEATEEGRGWGLVFHMLETSGRSARCRVRIFRNPTWARQTDLHNEVIVDLPIDGDAVLVDFTPHELARVEINLG